MRILILGGDGYLGWPTAMYLSSRGHEVSVADNMLRRRMHLERSTDSLTPILGLEQRIEAWERQSGHRIPHFVGDLCDGQFTDQLIRETQPEAIVHYGEQPSAPYSMKLSGSQRSSTFSRAVRLRIFRRRATASGRWASSPRR